MGTKERVAELNEMPPLAVTSKIYTIEDDIDPYGNHLHHTGPLKLFEQERVRIFEEYGMHIEQLAAEKGLFGFVYEISMKYGGQVLEGDEVNITTRVFQTRPTLLSFHQIISRGGNNLVEAVVDVALANKEGKPTRIPQEVLDQLRGQ